MHVIINGVGISGIALSILGPLLYYNMPIGSNKAQGDTTKVSLEPLKDGFSLTVEGNF